MLNSLLHGEDDQRGRIGLAGCNAYDFDVWVYFGAVGGGVVDEWGIGRPFCGEGELWFCQQSASRSLLSRAEVFLLECG